MTILEIKNIAIIFILYFLVFLIAEFFYRKKVSNFLTRKMVHIGGGLVTFLLPWFVSFFVAISIGLFFTALLYLAQKKRFFKSIDNDCSQNVGSYIYTLSMTISAILFWRENILIFQGAVLILSLADGFAAILGQFFKYLEFSINGKKTVSGSITFLIISWTILLILVSPENFSSLLQISLAAILLTLIEASFSKGWDNLFVVLAGGYLLSWLL